MRIGPNQLLNIACYELIKKSKINKEQNELMSLQAARGSSTSLKLWESSAHCEHYRQYPEAYIQELQDFVSSLK